MRGRTAYYIEKYGIVVFFSYKAGSTSVVDWVYRLIFPENADELSSRKKRIILSEKPFSIDLTEAYDFISRGITGIAFARNPYERIVSGFINKFVVDGDIWLDNNSKLEKVFQRFCNENGHLSFSVFIKLLERCDVNKAFLNHHFSTQVPPVLMEKRYFQHLIKLENVSEELPVVANKLGIPDLPFPRLRVTKVAESPETSGSIPLTDIHCQDLATMRCRPTLEALLGPESRRVINSVYSIDFMTFSYPKLNS